MSFDALRPSPWSRPAAARRKRSLLGRPWLEALEDRTLPAHPGPGLPHLDPPGLAESRGPADGSSHTPHPDTPGRAADSDGAAWQGGRGKGYDGEGNDRHASSRQEDRGGKAFGPEERDDEGGRGKRQEFRGEGRFARSRAALLPEQPDEQVAVPGAGAAEFTASAASVFASAPAAVAAEIVAPAVSPEDDSWVAALLGQPGELPAGPNDQGGQEAPPGGAPGNSAVFFTSLGGLAPVSLGGGDDLIDTQEERLVDQLPASGVDLGPMWGLEPLPAPDLAARLLRAEPRPDILPPDAPRAAPVVTLLGWEPVPDKPADAPPADPAVQDLFIDPLGVFGDAQEAPPPAAPAPDARTSSAGFGRAMRAAALAGALFLGVAFFAQQEVGRRPRRGRRDLP